MPRPLTPQEAHVVAEEYRHEAKQRRIEAQYLDALADAIEVEIKKGLPISSQRAINRHMPQANPLDVVRSQRSAGRGRVSDHPFPKALEAANLTMTELAGLLKEHRSTVKSWLQRKIPRAKAEAIAKLIDLPATTKSWPAGIKG